MSSSILVNSRQGLKEMYTSLKEEKVVACDLEATELDIRKSVLEGIGIGTSNKQFFINTSNGLDNKLISKALESVFKEKRVVFHNAKFDLSLLLAKKLPIPEHFEDTMIMSWLVDENNQHGLKALAKSILGREPKKWNELKKEQTLFTNKEDILKELADYCGDDVKNTYDLYEYFLPILKKDKLELDYRKIELNFIPVLIDMEMRGVKIDIDWLEKKKEKIEKILKRLEKGMQDILGDRFVNIRSSQQLENLLFSVLKYPPLKFTNAGKRSTDNDVLEQLVKDYELKEDDFIPMLLKFRELDKIYTTYLVALLEQVDDAGVIHANFLQHGTRTGRLSSSDPNLQNIPARSDDWNIRRAFVPKEGYKFVIADYSQIELRMLAHFSRDKNMIDTFLNDGDIHAKTMELTNTKRRVAKAINFGLVYGMGARTLAHTLGIKEDSAKLYIHKFFSGYPQVAAFISRIQNQALSKGYVEMITGRRRRFYEIKDKRWFNSIKRQAVNTKIQGSAADLIKVAMIKLSRRLKEYDAHQLIQIHDEIIVECPKDKVKKVKEIMIEVMDSALKLRVPLKIGIVEGDYWIKS